MPSAAAAASALPAFFFAFAAAAAAFFFLEMKSFIWLWFKDMPNSLRIACVLRDIACAQAFGARSLAVASGKCGAEELRTAGADCVVASLEYERARDFLGLSP